VTGPSGSGKSSLFLETLVPAVQRALREHGAEAPLPHRALRGTESLSTVVEVDQSPLGRTSRGNAATYLGAWDVIRKRYAREPIAKERDYGHAWFSFNVPGGRCETCGGDGAETVEMQFLADVTFSCPDCGGKRFVGPVLDVKHRGLDVAQLLETTIADAIALYGSDKGDKGVLARLGPAADVGLGYLKLGQSLNTLSGGEAQRLKLALALADTPPGALVVLDEPTAGLHAMDVDPLLAVLDRLVARGDTVACAIDVFMVLGDDLQGRVRQCQGRAQLTPARAMLRLGDPRGQTRVMEQRAQSHGAQAVAGHAHLARQHHRQQAHVQRVVVHQFIADLVGHQVDGNVRIQQHRVGHRVDQA
jgi:excinuclease UvrABC ATPase subunit